MTTWAEYAALPESQKIWLAEIELAYTDAEDAVQTVTRRYASEPYIDDDDIFWEHRLKGVPSFSRRLQQISGGQAQASFGTLEISNTNEDPIDADLANYVWAGREVVIKLGFEGMPTADFQTVFTGTMGFPEWDDRSIKVPISDPYANAFTRKLGESTISDTVPNILSAWLTDLGYTADSTLWDAWAAENNFSAWYDVTDSTTYKEAFDALLSPLCCWWGFSRDGLFQVGTFSAPTGLEAPDLIIADDIEATEYSGSFSSDLYWHVGASYWSNTAADPPETAETSIESSAVLDLCPLAYEGDAKVTLLTSSTDAATIRDRWWALLSTRREFATIKVKVQPLSLSLCDYVFLSRDRFGLELGGIFQVMGFEEDHTNNRVTLELFK